LNVKTPTSEKELALIDKCIIKTMRKFRETPKPFWSGDDICCHLKQLLLKGRRFRSGRTGNVFLKFPTRNTYERREDGTLFQSAAGRSEYFPIAGWASHVPTTWSHLTQRLSFAIELKYFPVIPAGWGIQIRNSLLVLSDEANDVPPRGRFFLLLTGEQTSSLRGELNAVLAGFPSVRCYQQIVQ